MPGNDNDSEGNKEHTTTPPHESIQETLKNIYVKDIKALQQRFIDQAITKCTTIAMKYIEESIQQEVKNAKE